MKYIFLYICILLGLTLQGQGNTDPKPKDSISNTNAKRTANEIGVEVLGLIDGRFLISYERSFGKHWTGLVGLGYKNDEGLVALSGIDREKLKTGGLSYSGGIYIAEGRYYIEEFDGGRALGFYFGLYLKHSDFQSDITGTYISDDQQEFTFLFDTSIGVTSVGFLVGYKLKLSKHLALDFLISGPGSGNYDFRLNNKSEELPDEFYEDLNDALENLGLLDLINADFDFGPNNSQSRFSTLSFRYGISLTYNF